MALCEMLDNAAAARPTTITLTGAGMNAANGVYSLVFPIISNINVKYVLNGFWEEYPATFTMGLSAFAGEWTIGVKQSDTEKAAALYKSPLFKNKKLRCVPRMKGWQGVQDNDTSQPTLEYGFE